MPEWRKDPVTGDWVVIAAERGRRPLECRTGPEERRQRSCALCAGREGETPPEVLAFRYPGSGPDGPGWWVRVVPNKFPAVCAEGELECRACGPYEVMDGVGAHEVIVESTDHEEELAHQSQRQVEEVLWAWRARLLDLRRDPRLRYIQIFKNKGSVAGASLEHTHSQLIAIPFVPARIAREMEGARVRFQLFGTCVFCDVLEYELRERDRLVCVGDHVVAFAPFASRFPYEVWVVGREHRPDFADLGEPQIRDLARVLRRVLAGLVEVACDPPYNMVLHTAPVNAGDVSFYHWHLELLPRLTVIAGFELGTGYYINHTAPEVAARLLRERMAEVQAIV